MAKLANQYQYSFIVVRHQFATKNGRILWVFHNLEMKIKKVEKVMLDLNSMNSFIYNLEYCSYF